MDDRHPLWSRLPPSPRPSADELLDAFLDYAIDAGLDLYPAQEEAILELLAGRHVILDTPTGSGKSLVALAAHFAALARGQRSFYTAPIKALVSEKFFALCRDLGSEQVGMLTGDVAVNPTAPVICCTAEIVANMALRQGADAPIDVVIMDEFHYYADRDRGWAWQVPLLELPRAQFLLMSATLGPTRRLQEDLEARTGVPCTLVKRGERPVPLEFEYHHTPIHQTVATLLEKQLAPIYIVHFTQNAATDQAQALTSLDICSKEEKAAIKEAVGGFRFDSGFGVDLRRFVGHGIGVHHAGMLPKYRLLVEKLAQEGKLKVICGTDTLGVGINVPIRTVLFTQLCKYDGASTRVLSVREFRQIAGRAGRKGYDDRGWVWAQAPEHVIENLRGEAAAATDPKKKKKLVKRKQPEWGYAHWDEKTFERLTTAEPEPLTSSFRVTHAMLLEMLDRPGDGRQAVKELLQAVHEPRPAFRRHVRRAISIYRSLVAEGIVEVLEEHPDDQGRLVRVNLDLQEDFRLNQPLSPWVLDTVARLDPASVEYAADVLSVVESVLENPEAILRKQLERAKNEAMTEMKRQGIEYEERMARLAEVTYPKPKGEFLYEAFNAWRPRHPWVEESIKPKSVARELYERGMSFREYVGDYGLKRSEGVVLRYLTDAYKTLVQTVPIAASTEDVDDMIEWLGLTVRSVDSSLIDEWERLKNPEDEAPVVPQAPPDITSNRRVFRVLVRNMVFSWVQALARADWTVFENVETAAGVDGGRWTRERLWEATTAFREEHGALRTDAEARGPAWFQVEESPTTWLVRQVLLDDEESSEWSLLARVDLERSRAEERAVVQLVDLGPTGAAAPA